MKTLPFISRYWPTARDYAFFVIGCAMLASPFMFCFIGELLYETTTLQIKNSTFFTLLFFWFLPAIFLGIVFLLFGIAHLKDCKKTIFAIRPWLAIIIIAFLACSVLLGSFGIEGYCGERLQQSCGEWH